VVLNHPSWWDPLTCLALSELFVGRTHYVPIDAAALARYRFFAKLGFFGVEPGTVKGAAAFLRTGLAILARPRTMLWITGQGRFADPRERPVRLRPGIGHLARHLGRGTILPLALEYPFWDERLPEALAQFGKPIAIVPGLSPAQYLSAVEVELQAAQDALASHARQRDPAAFETLLDGKVGIGGVYDWWRWFQCKITGKPFHPAHGEK
jgi:1-acyl-sn-glycerol-3-phosphate acyltransferase